MPGPVALTIILNPAAQTDAEELDVLTRQLRQDILDLEIEDVRPLAADEGPEWAKSGIPNWTSQNQKAFCHECHEFY